MHLNHLDLNLLVALDALLDERSVTLAARRLHLSPSATSGALARLRLYFDDSLLTKVGRRMVLTPLGETLQSQVRDCLLRIRATIEVRPRFDASATRRKFTLMMSDYVATVLMPAVVQRIEREAPQIELEMRGYENERHAVDRGEIDFLIIPTIFLPQRHPAEILFEDDFVFVCSRDNDRVGDRLSPAQIIEMDHVMPYVGTGHVPAFDSWMSERLGRLPRTVIVAMNFITVPHLVAGTKRIAIMQRRLAATFARTLPIRIVEPPFEVPRLVEMIQWHEYRSHDPAHLWLRNLMKEAGRQSLP